MTNTPAAYETVILAVKAAERLAPLLPRLPDAVLRAAFPALLPTAATAWIAPSVAPIAGVHYARRSELHVHVHLDAEASRDFLGAAQAVE